MSNEECTYSMNNGEGIVGRLINIYRDRLENTEFISNPIGRYVGNIFTDGTIDKQTAGIVLQSFLTKHRDWALNPTHIYKICVYHKPFLGDIGGNAMFIHGDDYIKPFEERATEHYQKFINACVDCIEDKGLKSEVDFIEIEYLKVASNFDLFNEIGEQYAKAALPSVYNRGFQRICVDIYPYKTIISLNQNGNWKSS